METVTLLTPLRIEQADLVANRAGRLGERQKRSRRRRALLGTLICVWVAVVFFVEGARSHANGGQWLVPELIGAIVLALGLRFAVARLRDLDPAVRCLTGPVLLELARTGAAFGGASLQLTAAGERCRVPQSLHSTYKSWRRALTDRPYHVYVIGEPPGTVVGLEPADSRLGVPAGGHPSKAGFP
jgi:hypothetical protein